MTQADEKLKGLLGELFQFDREDLDFGIYRIMDHRREEIRRFLDNDLLPQVEDAFREYTAPWLDPEMRDPVSLLPLLAPYPTGVMETYPVSRAVNSPSNDGPVCVEPAA